MEAAIQTVLASPTTWPVIEEPQIRRYLPDDFRILFTIGGNRSEIEFPFTP